MPSPARLITATLTAGLLHVATGCHYDYGYTSVGYSYGYDCSPRYDYTWGCDYGYGYSPRYHVPCDGIRFRTGHAYGYSRGYGYGYRRCR